MSVPLAMAFLRLPLLAVGIGGATAWFAVRGASAPFQLALTTPTALMLGVNLVSLMVLRHLMKREGRRLVDLIGFDRSRIGRDIAFGLLWLVVLNVPFIVVVVAVTALVTLPSSGAEFGAAFERVFAGDSATYEAVAFPLWWAVLAGVSFALLNPVVEEMHYRGFVQPRLTAATGSRVIGIGVMAVGFAVQHVAYGVSAAGVAVYVAAFLVWGIGAGLIYQWQRRLPSLIVTHFVVNASFGVLPIVLAVTASAS